MPKRVSTKIFQQIVIITALCFGIVLSRGPVQPSLVSAQESPATSPADTATQPVPKKPRWLQENPSTVGTDTQETDPSQIEIWIRELGSSSSDLRESAADNLYRSGSIALPLVKLSASESDEPEVKARCASLAIAIEKDDLGKRVDQFLRESDLNKTYGLNNWPNFSKIVGPGRLSKRLFKEIIQTHPKFAEDSFEDSSILLIETERIGREILLGLRTGEETNLGDIVTLMFASIQLSSLNVNVPRDIELTTSTLTRRTPFPQEVQGTALGTPLKALFREWMKTADSEPQMVMITCMELGIEEGKVVARKYLEDKNLGPDLYEISMACMMRFSTPEDLMWIKPWIADERGLTPVFPIQTNIPMRQAPFEAPRIERMEPEKPVVPKIVDVQAQYRDLALAAGFKAFGEDVTKYYPRAQWHPYRGFSATSLALPVADSSKRDAVDARWKELVELQSKPPTLEGESDTPSLTPPVEIKN